MQRSHSGAGEGSLSLGSARKIREDESKEGIDASSIVSAESLVGAVKTGYMNKRSEQGIVKNWKRRWVAIVGNLLYYYADEVAKAPQGRAAAERTI